MLQPESKDGTTLARRSPEPVPGSTAAVEDSLEPIPAIGELQPADAALAMARFGSIAGWGMLALGLLLGASVAVARAEVGPATASVYVRAILDGTATALALWLAGWALRVACQVVAARVVHRAGRTGPMADDWIDVARRTAAAVERLVEVLERRPIAAAAANPPVHDRAQLPAEIDGSARGGDDAAAQERLEAARRDEADAHLAQIDAARRVKDPDRVLELFRAMVPSLHAERRGDLERDLAKWFLELLHRRLRVVPIQADVVHLAAQVAETFGATMEGASLRASLPTLRRSVGLCPRCAQPYLGTAAACPKCQTGAAAGPAPGGTAPAIPTEAG